MEMSDLDRCLPPDTPDVSGSPPSPNSPPLHSTSPESSVYSIASSRTESTNYGIYARRMSLSDLETLPGDWSERFSPLTSILSDISASPPFPERTVPIERVQMTEAVFFTPSPPTLRSILPSPPIRPENDMDIGDTAVDLDAYESPVDLDAYESPVDESASEAKNERRYRLLLTHEFHPSLILPLWDPSPVELGAVGYLSKPKGSFVTLFNAYDPRKSDKRIIQSLPSVHGYGTVKDDVQRLPKRTITQRTLDRIIGSLTFRNSSKAIVRRPTFPLKVGHKAAYLYAEIAEYRYMATLAAPKAWFRSNVDVIFNTYGSQHPIQKEDLYFVIATLRTPNYALLVSHSHPEGHARFNVYANPKVGQPWGTFTTDIEVTPVKPSPSNDLEGFPEIPLLSASKVSIHGSRGPWDTVLLARLRFKPDALEPTSQ